MATSPASKTLVKGEFVDRHVPSLPSDDDEFSPVKRNRLVAVFRSEFEDFLQTSFPLSSSIHSGPSDYQERMKENGFWFEVLRYEQICGGELWKNGDLLARSNSENKLPPGSLSRTLYDKVVNSRSGSESIISRISFLFDYHWSLHEGDNFEYQFYYRDVYKASVDVDKEYLVKACEPLAKFISSIEGQFHNEPGGFDNG